MQRDAPESSKSEKSSKLGLWVGIGVLALLLSLFLFGRYSEFLNIEALERAIVTFADGPWGVPALILTFCACAFIGVPQFLLIGIAVYAFGAALGRGLGVGGDVVFRDAYVLAWALVQRSNTKSIRPGPGQAVH